MADEVNLPGTRYCCWCCSWQTVMVQDLLRASLQTMGSLHVAAVRDATAAQAHKILHDLQI